MRLKKFVKTLGVTMAIATMFTVPALAQRMSFDLTVYYENDEDGDGYEQFTDTNPKDDDEQASHVHIQGGNLSYSDDFYMSSNGPWYYNYNYTGNVQVTPDDLDPILTFTKGYAEANSLLRLRAVTYAYQVHVYGYWYS